MDIKKTEFYSKIVALHYCKPHTFKTNFKSIESQIINEWNKRRNPTFHEQMAFEQLMTELDCIWAVKMLNYNVTPDVSLSIKSIKEAK